MDRRRFLTAGGAVVLTAAAPGVAALAQTNEALPATFGRPYVQAIAADLARRPFVRPKLELAGAYAKLTQQQFRDIKFREDQALWRGTDLEWEGHLLPMGWIYDAPVSVAVVEDGQIRGLTSDSSLFAFGPIVGPPPGGKEIGFSGFKLHAPLNRADRLEEIVTFQGASYFRALARGLVYGITARGLAINTGRPGGEEFPLFRAFFIERPTGAGEPVIVHAVLDSPSVTGAYRITVKPGPTTIMDVTVTLYPRADLPTVGLAPLNSMYLQGSSSLRDFGDLRPEVHGSDGLAIVNGAGERLWRPLMNPKRLQMSAFLDRDLQGFGLLQRERRQSAYEDLDLTFERRPSVWVEPQGRWGFGAVELVEIPSDEDIHENIVAFWRPAEPLVKNKAHDFAYRLYWSTSVPFEWPGAVVRQTRVGLGRRQGTFRYVVDFAGGGLREASEMPLPALTASVGQVSTPQVRPYPEIGGVRVSFELEPRGAELVELRLSLRAKDKRISEVWLQRWVRD